MSPSDALLPPDKLPTETNILVQTPLEHGIASRHPVVAAQVPLPPEDMEKQGQSVLVGGGLMVGAAVGAVLGVMVAGPAGVLVGTGLGAVVGAAGAANTAVTDQMPLQDPGR